MSQAKFSLRVSTFQWTDPTSCDDIYALVRDYRGLLDEVAFFTGFTHAPLTVSTIRERAAILTELIPRFKALGLSVGINHLATLGHLDENLDNSLNEPWQHLVDCSGAVSKSCYCPADPRVKAYTADSYIAWAQAGPDFLWIDDDVRLEGHPPAINVACFCDRCLANFSAEHGSAWTREELVAAFGAGTLAERMALRQAWLTHNRGTLTTLLKEIRAAVDTINPALPLGLMTCELLYSGYGFADWAEALAGPRKVPVMWRPGGGFYTDVSPGGMLEKAQQIGRQIAYLPSQVTDIQSEIESFPYQRLKKSATVTGMETALYLAAGCTGAALNICGTVRDPVEEYRPLFDKTQELQAFSDEAVATFGRGRSLGLWPAMNGNYLATRNADSAWFGPGRWPSVGLAAELAEIGLPLAYTREGAAATILIGDSCLAFSREELLDILAGGVLMDGMALKRLHALGLGAYTGFAVTSTREDDTVELLTDDPLNGPYIGRHRDARQSFKWWAETAYLLEPLTAQSRIISSGVDFIDRPLGPLAGIFENSLGGRVAINGFFPWTYLMSQAKSAQMKALARWISRDTLPTLVDSYQRISLWCRQDADDRPALFLVNATLDVAENVRLLVRTTCGRLDLFHADELITCLPPEGTDGDYTIFEIDRLEPWEMAIATLQE
ncbi:MAG TPA: hypothetical protein VGM23_01210 [Armatimonadota bacterium]